MKNIFIPLLSILSLSLILFSCGEREGKRDLNPSYSLVIYDSIDLPDHKAIYIKDYNPKTRTYVGMFDTDVVGFTKDSLMFSWSRYGNGNEEYNNQFVFKYSNVKFDNDSTLMINSYHYLKYYDLLGNFKNNVRIDSNLYTNTRMILGKNPFNDSEYVFQGCNSSTEESLNREYTNVELNQYHNFFVFDTINRCSKLYGKPEKESIINIEGKGFEYHDPKVCLNKANKSVEVLFDQDFKVFSYNLDNLLSYNIIQLKPDYATKQMFIEEESYTDKSYELADKRHALSTYYKHFYTSKDTIISLYKSGVSEKVFDEEIRAGQGHWDIYNKYAKPYIEYYINGKKQTNDIPLDKNYYLLFINGTNDIILAKRDQEITINNEPKRRLFFAKLEKL
ncbi:MAG: hypothetical protein ACEPOV_10480 [Hyphomicrobiales bacterium]